MTQSRRELVADTGSFRDPCGRVYEYQGRIIRGIDVQTAQDHEKLSHEPFFTHGTEQGSIIPTIRINSEAFAPSDEPGPEPWAAYLEHERIPFITYPYEWSFSMLRDAALLQLGLVEDALSAGWTLKDCTPYNIQWRGPRPVFIDTPSFYPRLPGEQWIGYRQFCMLFLAPLMIKGYLDISHTDLLRANLDGLAPPEAAKYFRGMARFRRGVLPHIIFPAAVERAISRRERDAVPAQKRGLAVQSDAMVIGLVQQMKRLVSSIRRPIEHTDWSNYERTHSYDEAEFKEKEAFVRQHASSGSRSMVWDIGCNTGHFSKICAEFANCVVAIDGDHDAIEQLYNREKDARDSKILPLNMNLANLSPAQGWGGIERKAFDRRGSPDLVLCLALIHHIRISSNIPTALFLDWLHSLHADVIIEFVDRSDDMVIKLLTNKKEQYADYSLEIFEGQVQQRFEVVDSEDLKGGKRRIYMLRPK